MAALKLESGNRKIPGKVTFLSIIQACGNSGNLEKGRLFHGYVVQILTVPNIFIGNTLVAMYAKCGCVEDAWQVFDRLNDPNVVSWSAMIAGYARLGYPKEAIKLYHQMQLEGVKPNEVTFLGMLVACTRLELLEQGKRLHALILNNGKLMIIEVFNALISMYVKFGNMKEAHNLFRKMASHDVVSWNAIVAGYAQHGPEEEAVKLYNDMKNSNIMPDQVTYLGILLACGSLAALELGKKLHIEILKLGFDSEIEITNTIMNMYAKCGCINVAFYMFQNSDRYNIASWSVMIAAYAQHGSGMEAISLIDRMDLNGFKMDHIAFVNKLTACSHSGLIDAGYYVLCSMERDHAIKPSEEHYACMVDLLGRAGLLRQGKRLIQNMPCKPSLNLWRALLGACKIHGDVKLAKWAMENILSLEPSDTAASMMLSNISSLVGSKESSAQKL